MLLNPAPAQLEAYSSQVMITDDNVDAYRDRRAGISDVPDAVRRVDGNLDALAGLRDQVRKDARASVSAIAFSYRILIADLLSYRESVARPAPRPSSPTRSARRPRCPVRRRPSASSRRPSCAPSRRAS